MVTDECCAHEELDVKGASVVYSRTEDKKRGVKKRSVFCVGALSVRRGRGFGWDKSKGTGKIRRADWSITPLDPVRQVM